MTHRERYAFSDYLHSEKASGRVGSAKGGDFTYAELLALGQEFLASHRQQRRRR